MPLPNVQSAPERDNRMVWEGRPGHYEVWYLTLNHRPTGTGFWIRYTLEAPRPGQGEPYAQLWFSRFDPADPDGTFGIAKKFPVVELTAVAEPFSVAIGDARLGQDGMRGGIQGGGHDISWKLEWEPAPETFHHLPQLFYTVPVDTRVLSPNPSIAVRGTITVDGRTYELSGEPGGQTHVWGKKHAYSWAWSHCNAFEGQEGPGGAFFESISAKLKRGQIILPTLTVFALGLEGELIQLNQPWSLPLNRSTFSTGTYHLIGSTPDTRVEAQFTCRPEDTLLAEYLDPDGDPAFNHISCCADATVTVKKRSPFVGRFRDHRTLTCKRMAHFEWGARAGDIVKVRKTLVQI